MRSILLATISFAPLGAMAATTCGGVSGGNTQLDQIMVRVTDAATTVGAAIAVIGFIVAGILYLTAGGGERLSTAKKALVAAVIGTALLALAQAGKVMTDIFCKIIAP